MPAFVTSADGVRIAVHESGNPDGPVVVAVHGYPDNHRVWDGVAAELEADLRIVRYDVRGAGSSDKPSGRASYRMERLGDDLAAVVDATSPDAPVHLLGHDWGSIQLWDTLTRPDLAGRIASFTSVSGPSLDFSVAWMRGNASPAALRQTVASWYMLFFQVPVVPEATLRRAPVERVAGSAFARSEADKVNGINLYRANVLPRVLRPRPRRIDVPVQVVVLADDPFVRPETAALGPAPFVTDLTVEEVPGGHWVLTESPHLVADRVRSFVEARSVSR